MCYIQRFFANKKLLFTNIIDVNFRCCPFLKSAELEGLRQQSKLFLGFKRANADYCIFFWRKKNYFITRGKLTEYKKKTSLGG